MCFLENNIIRTVLQKTTFQILLYCLIIWVTQYITPAPNYVIS